MIHAAVSPSLSLSDFPTTHIVAASVLYTMGTLFYTSRFPEKFFRNVFDVWVSLRDAHLAGLLESNQFITKRVQAIRSSTSLSTLAKCAFC